LEHLRSINESKSFYWELKKAERTFNLEQYYVKKKKESS
jgi:hypothetical protein